MPSVRPKLVQEGAPIAGAAPLPAMSDDGATMKAGDNLFVIGGGSGGGAATMSSLNSSLSSLSMNVSSKQHHDDSNRRRSTTSLAAAKTSSSLARAAKGTLIKEKPRKSVVQTSFVVGAGAGASNFHEEEKKSESPTQMVMDASSGGSGQKRRGSRNTAIATSYQIPDTSESNLDVSLRSLGTGGDMEGVEPTSPSKTKQTVTKFVVEPKATTIQPKSFTIGGSNNHNSEDMHTDEPEGRNDHDNVNNSHDEADEEQTVEKMEGVIDLSEKPPLCVLDGANLAYAYAKAAQGGTSLSNSQAKPEPDTRGIVVACQYFQTAGIRVLAVIPTTFTHRDPHQQILKPLEEQGLLVEAPSKDDDDAYAITIARREDAKAQQRGDGPGYVMSNDMFRDAQQRSKEEGGGDELKEWLTEGSSNESGKTGPGRISFAFLDTGSLDDHGDKVLDIMPNPRHPLVQFVESQSRGGADNNNNNNNQ